MKITIEEGFLQEDEFILKCRQLNNSLEHIVSYIKNYNDNLHVQLNGEIHRIHPADILYFEAEKYYYFFTG